MILLMPSKKNTIKLTTQQSTRLLMNFKKDSNVVVTTTGKTGKIPNIGKIMEPFQDHAAKIKIIVDQAKELILFRRFLFIKLSG